MKKTNKNTSLTFLDLFAGAGGLSEGFIRAGFKPLAHVESDSAACYTLKTRVAYHWLNQSGEIERYNSYLDGNLSRNELYASIPEKHIASVINAEIGEDTLEKIFHSIDLMLGSSSLDLIVGGPPCQAYSLAGRSRDKNGMIGDARNYLYIYYCEFLKRYKPKYFVFENVLGLLSASDINGFSYLDSMTKMFKEAGYLTKARVLSANDYGVLQKRKRVIIVGTRKGDGPYFPLPDKWLPEVKVRELFRDLPKLKAGEGRIEPRKLKKYSGNYLFEAGIRNGNNEVTFHIARPHNKQDLEIYRLVVEQWNQEGTRLRYNDLPNSLKTHKNRTSFIDRFKVVSANLPESHTVVAHIAKDGHYYIHPDIKQNRSLTPREAARLQTFPDDYFFEGCSEKRGRTPAFRQIGNAVPVLLAQKIAEKLCENW